MDKSSKKWKPIEPVPEEEMARISFHYTVCEILREIYRATNDPEIKLKCRMASKLAKVMAGIITKHRGRGWGKKFYPWNLNKERTKHG